MKKYFLVPLLFISCMGFGQNNCQQFNQAVDSIYVINQLLKEHTSDTAFIKNIVLNKYLQVSLYNQQPRTIPVGGYLFFSVDKSYLLPLHQCIIDKASKNGWYVEIMAADASGFSRVNVYTSKKKKNRILLYNQDVLDNTKVKIGFSIN